jgi:hypothetical protein
MLKKYWQLTLLALYACGFSYGENNLGAARTVISREAHVPLTALSGGGALNYLLLVGVSLMTSYQIEIALTKMVTGLRKHLLDSTRDENWSPTCSAYYYFVRSRYETYT